MLIDSLRNIRRLLVPRFGKYKSKVRRRFRQTARNIAAESLEARMLLAAPLVADVLAGNTDTLIRGFVYEDGNSNGIKDGNDDGVAGWTVYLDLDNSGTLNTDAVGTLEPSDVTNVDGEFIIDRLIPGT
jgi:hypothetical protein